MKYVYDILMTYKYDASDVSDVKRRNTSVMHHLRSNIITIIHLNVAYSNDASDVNNV